MLNLGLGLKLTQVQASAAPAGHTYGPNRISGSPSLSNLDSGNPPTWDGTTLSFTDQGGNGAQLAIWTATIQAVTDYRVTATASGYGGSSRISVVVGPPGGVSALISADGAFSATVRSGGSPGQTIGFSQSPVDDSCTIALSNIVVQQILT